MNPDTQAPHRNSELLPRSLEDVLEEQCLSQVAPRNGAVLGTVARLDLESMQVVVRIRPLGDPAAPQTLSNACVHAVSQKSLAIAAPEGCQGHKTGVQGRTFTFSAVFDAETSQQNFFEATAKLMVTDILSGKKKACAMMAYGMSSAGKTHTMEGSKGQAGVVPLAMQLLLTECHQKYPGTTVYVSRYEVYNERIYDLLNEGVMPLEGWRHLEVKEDSLGQIFVDGLNQVPLESLEHAMEILKRSSKQRRKATTGLNYSSSRSHSVFVVSLQWPKEAACRKGKSTVSFIDLAGSERVKNTGNAGERLGESKAINSSLMTLRYCLENLRWNQKNPRLKPRQLPYRESKITYIFRDLLHGWGSIVFCVNVSPLASEFDGTINVLQYAAMAAQIGLVAKGQAPKRELKAKSPSFLKRQRLRETKSREDKNGERALEESRASQLQNLAAIRQLGEKLEDLEDHNLELQGTVTNLMTELAHEREMRAVAETEIRESVSAEMEDLLKDMQSSYKERLLSEVDSIEKKYKRILEMQGNSRTFGLDLNATDVAKISSLKETIEALQARCHDLEARVQHAQDREAELAGELCIRDEQNLHLEQRAQAQAQQISREQEKLEQCRLENAAMVEMHTKEVKRWQEQMSVRIQERDLALASLQASQEEARHAAEEAQVLVDRNAAMEKELNIQKSHVDEYKHKTDALHETCASLERQLEEQAHAHDSRIEALTASSNEAWEKESRQSKANAAAEREMLESQLERAGKEKASLLQRLKFALNCTPDGTRAPLEGPVIPTPHFIALARAKQSEPNAPHQVSNIGLAAAQTQVKTTFLEPCQASPAFSPAIQWNATPHACSLVCGKVPRSQSHLSQVDNRCQAEATLLVKEPHKEADMAQSLQEGISHTDPVGQSDTVLPSREGSAAHCMESNEQSSQLSDKDEQALECGVKRRPSGEAQTHPDVAILQPSNGTRRLRGKRGPTKASQQSKPPAQRKRKLLAPTPFKVRLALGQEDFGDENVDPL